jgi:hypothetical protein
MLKVLRARLRELNPYREQALEFISRIENIAPFKWIIEYKENIASILYLLWIIGCISWLYQLVIVDASPYMGGFFSIDDPRDAIVFLFFGTFGVIYFSFFAFFIIKLIHNMIRGGIDSLFPRKWYSMVRSIGLLICLHFAFIYIGHIKTAGLTAYTQVSQLVRVSNDHSLITKKKIDVSELLDMLQEKVEQ